MSGLKTVNLANPDMNVQVKNGQFSFFSPDIQVRVGLTDAKN